MDAFVAIPDRQAYERCASQCSQKLVQSIRDDLFPDEGTEKMFGIVMKDTANDRLGDLIYYAWTEIYRYHLSLVAGENIYGPPGPASHQFVADVTRALVEARLAPTFRNWVDQVIQDENFARDIACRELRAKNLNWDLYIHPDSEMHCGWMQRLQLAFGNGRHGQVLEPMTTAEFASAMTGHNNANSNSSSNAITERFCEFCGEYGARSRCSSCKEVYYCNKDHQKLDWKQHKSWCTAIAANHVCVFIEVGEGEGTGLGNRQTNHIFATKTEALDYVGQQFGNASVSPPLRSPFCELNGWKMEIYCNLAYNRVDTYPQSSGRPPATALGKDPAHLNAAGVYLGTDWRAGGMTHYNNMAGTIFITGRNKSNGRPLHANVLEGLLVFIADAMDLYGEGMSDATIVGTLQRWASQYRAGTWKSDEDDAEDIYYSSDYRQGALDHR